MRHAETALMVACGIGVFLFATNAFAAGGFVETVGDNGESVPAPDMTPPAPIPMNTNQGENMDTQLAALLATIRHFESGDNYTVLYGGGHFADDSQHPNVRVPINLPGYEGKVSTAAGAYQINHPTYLQFAPPLGITDFSATSQDAIAVAILQFEGAVDMLAQGDVPGAMQRAGRRWASMPGSTANQGAKSIDVAMNYFYGQGGTYA